MFEDSDKKTYMTVFDRKMLSNFKFCTKFCHNKSWSGSLSGWNTGFNLCSNRCSLKFFVSMCTGIWKPWTGFAAGSCWRDRPRWPAVPSSSSNCSCDQSSNNSTVHTEQCTVRTLYTHPAFYGINYSSLKFEPVFIIIWKLYLWICN